MRDVSPGEFPRDRFLKPSKTYHLQVRAFDQSPQNGLLAKNAILNFIGQVVPLFIGVATIPFIVRGLGVERFGVLALAWVVLGYFGLFNLGLGRATTKFVAEYLSQGKIRELPGLVWTSVGLQLLLGVFGGFLFASFVPLLVTGVFNIPPPLMGEAERSFFLLTASLPVVMATTGLRGVLEAGQRFDLVNLVRVPSSSLNFLIPVAALPLGLSGIVFLLIMAKLAAAFVYLIFCFRAFPFLRRAFAFQAKLIRPLFAYGGWVTVSNVVSPLLLYLDRFFIGSLLTMAAVTYYTAPYEMLTRLSIFPTSLMATLFPAFSALGTAGAGEDLERFYLRSVKCLFLIMGPVVFILFLFAGEILWAWLGVDFVERSTLVFQILAVGVLVNSLAFVPFSLLQGLGRPDITAKFHLTELPIHVGLVWFLVRNMGIKGAALAWSFRVGLDAVLLFGASWRLYRMRPRALARNNFLRSVMAVAMLVGALFTARRVGGAVLIQIVLVAVVIVLFVLLVWRYVLDGTDRSSFTSALGQLVGMVRVKGGMDEI